MTDGTEQLPPSRPAYWQPPATVPAPRGPEPDWAALADRQEEHVRRRRRRQLIAGGAALVAVVGVSAATVVLKNQSGSARPDAAATAPGGSASASALDVAPVPAESAPAASASASGSGSAAPAPSASAGGAKSAAPAPSATRAPVTTPTVPGHADQIADHTGQNNLALGPDCAVKQIDGGWVFGGRGTAGSYAQAPGRVVDTSRSFTVSAWVVNDAAAGSRSAISQGDGAFSAFDLGREDAGGQKSWVFRVQTGSGAADSATVRAAVPGAAKTGAFTLLTAAYDAGQHTLTLYVDGAAAGTAKVTGSVTGSGPLELGRSRTGGAWADPWTGVIGHVQVFDRPLSAAEAARIKASGGPGFPAVADWLV